MKLRASHPNFSFSAFQRFSICPCDWTLFSCAAVLIASALSLHAQVAAPPPQDPLITLMASQPKIAIPVVTKVTAAFDPPVVRPGEQAFLRVALNALEESVAWPTNLAGPSQLAIRPGAHMQMMQFTGTNMEPRTAFNYRVRPSSLGVFTVPEFVVKVDGKPVKVPAAQLEVMSEPPASVTPAALLMFGLPVTNLFVGQAVQARVVLPAGLGQGLMQLQLSGHGLLTDQGTTRQHIEMVLRDGVNMPSFIYEMTFTPMLAGKLTVFAQGFTITRRMPSPVVTNGAPPVPPVQPQFTLIESDPVEVNVRPLPREGELPGFTGAIGSLAVGPPKLATNVLHVGDPVRLTVNVMNRGDGPLGRLVNPPPPQAPDWQVFVANDFSAPQPLPPQQVVAPPRPGVPAQVGTVEGVVTFNYTLIPLTESARATPPIPFSYFDPKAVRYVDLTIPSVAVTVKPGAVPGDLATLMQTNPAVMEPEKELVLSGLAGSRGRTASSLVPPQQRAWFPLVQLAPAVAFFGLWRWDRRRRYLEKHPEIILRRRARRALHRQWRILRRAGRAADARGYAAAGVDAMRVACAPHYPAEPRALVGADVLPLLPEIERTGRAGEVVRRFFAVTDAVRFDTAPPSATELLSLQPELERVLQQLEQKL
jgi:hypothetical protein